MIPSYRLLSAPGGRPRSALLLLHGILGRGANWHTVARRITARRPDWAAVLVDLRMHGRSLGFAAPHTVEAAAADLAALSRALPLPVRAVLGHSFGGKVALSRARQVARPLQCVLVVDSMPGRRPTGSGARDVLRTVAALARMPRHYERRQQLIDRLRAEGRDERMARWLAMNLGPGPEGGLELRLDLPAVDALLRSYFETDLWPVVEAPPPGTALHLIIAGRSRVYGRAERARAFRAAARGSAHVIVIEEAGHWVHVDAPDTLVSHVCAALGQDGAADAAQARDGAPSGPQT